MCLDVYVRQFFKWVKVILKMEENLFEYRSIISVIYHPLYSMNKFVTNKAKLPQDGAQVFHVTLWAGHMIAKHPI